MTKQTLSILLAATVIVAGLVLLLANSGGTIGEFAGQSTFPEVAGKLDTIDRIEISGVSEAVTLIKREGNWQVEERFAYPVEFGKLVRFIDQLEVAEIAQRKTNRRANHEALDLAGVELAGSATRRVQLHAGQSQLVDMLLGKSASKQSGQYFRFIGDDQVWLLNQKFDIGESPGAWLRQQIIDIDQGQVLEVIQTSTAGEVIKMARHDSSSKFEVSNLPDGMELKYPSVANSIAGGLAGLELVDVGRATSRQWSDAATTLYRCRGGVSFRVLSKEIDGRHWIRIESEVETVPKEAGNVEQGDNAAALDYASLLHPWAFEVTNLSFAEFQKSADDLFKTLENVQAKPSLSGKAM